MKKTSTINVEKNNSKNNWNFLHSKSREVSGIIFDNKIDSYTAKRSEREKLDTLINFVSKLIIINKELVDFQETKIDNNTSRRWHTIYKKVNTLLNKSIKKITKYKKYNENIELVSPNVIEIKNISKIYSTTSINTKVLNNVSLNIVEGDFVVILGPSGSGKTSLMNILSGIDQPTYGSINVAGFNLHELSNSELTNFRQVVIGYIFQRYGLLPNLTVFENVAMGSFLGHELAKSKSRILSSRILPADEKKIFDILNLVEMFNCKDKYPYELSGGQKQRTSIARTIAKSPRIIFGDEPTAAVDEEMSSSIIDLFCKINREYKTTIIIITHDARIASYANRVIYVKDGSIEKIVVKNKKGKNEI
ncbi:MAG: ABC transporter ATP-binding protein [Malacoplasma sp.]